MEGVSFWWLLERCSVGVLLVVRQIFYTWDMLFYGRYPRLIKVFWLTSDECEM